jgi:outer membrane protein TolC
MLTHLIFQHSYQRAFVIHFRRLISATLYFSFFGSIHLSLLANEPDQSAEVLEPVPLDQLNSELKVHIEKAAVNSWDMTLQDILVKRGEATSTRMSSGKGIKLRLNTNVGFEDEDSGGLDSQGFQFRYNLTAKKPLYHWGALEADHEYGLLHVESSKYHRQIAFLGLYQKLVNSYADYIVLKQRQIEQVSSLELFEADIKLYRGQVERGEMSNSRFVLEEAKFERSKLVYESLKNQIVKLEESFRTVVGIAEEVPIAYGIHLDSAANDFSATESQINAFVSQIDKLSLRFQEKKFRLEQEDLRLQKYTVINRPKLDGLLRFRRDSETIATGNRNDLELQEAFAGIELNWSLYDSGAKKGFVLDSIQSKRQLERELFNLKDSIASDLRYKLANLKVLVPQSRLDEQDFGWAVGSYNQALEDRKAGRVSEKDLLILSRNVEIAKTKVFVSRANYFKALASLHVAMESASILAYLN